MPIGVTLLDLRRDLRAETGQTLNPSQAVASQATQDNHLNRQQRELWEAYAWPHLRYWVDTLATAGQSLYSYPNDMPFDQITRIYWAAGGEDWKELDYGLRAHDFHPSQVEVGTPRRWGNKVTVTGGVTNMTGQMQLLPTPGQAGMLRFEGQAPLTPLVSESDRCLLDSTAIVLFAAAEIQAINKVEAATVKLQKARDHLRRLHINTGSFKRKNYNMGGVSRARSDNSVPYLDYIP